MTLLEEIAQHIKEANNFSYSESVVSWTEIRKILERYQIEHLEAPPDKKL